MTSKKIRPTVRFSERQYELIATKLKERDVSFQQYCLELICKDLDVPVGDCEDLRDDLEQLDIFSNS